MLLFRVLPYAFGASHVLLAVAWWRWWGDDRSRHPESRAALLLIGLSTASAAVALFWISAVTRRAIGPGTDAARVVYETASSAIFYLVMAGIACTVLGKGRGRLLGLVVALVNLVAWVPIIAF